LPAVLVPLKCRW